MKEDLKWLGKKKETFGFGNWLWIKLYENGAIVTKRKGGRIILNSKYDIGYLIYAIKELSPTNYFSEKELDYIGYAFPKTIKFIERFKKKGISNAELLEIKETYDLKNKIIEGLKEHDR